MKKILLLLALIQTGDLFSIDNYIGYTPKEIVTELNAPDYVLSQRGDRPEEDDVIFFYNNRLYIYFNENRVWQMRVDEQFSASVLNVKIGDKRSVVKEILGEPLEERENSYIYRRPDKGYPVILRVYFSGDIVNDIYLYRGDY